MGSNSPVSTRNPQRVAMNAGTNGHKPEVLRLENLSVYYDTPRGPIHAVEDVTFALRVWLRQIDDGLDNYATPQATGPCGRGQHPARRDKST